MSQQQTSFAHDVPLQTESVTHWHDLPMETIQRIYSFLPCITDLFRMEESCHQQDMWCLLNKRRLYGRLRFHFGHFYLAPDIYLPRVVAGIKTLRMLANVLKPDDYAHVTIHTFELDEKDILSCCSNTEPIIALFARVHHLHIHRVIPPWLQSLFPRFSRLHSLTIHDSVKNNNLASVFAFLTSDAFAQSSIHELVMQRDKIVPANLQWWEYDQQKQSHRQCVSSDRSLSSIQSQNESTQSCCGLFGVSVMALSNKPTVRRLVIRNMPIPDWCTYHGSHFIANYDLSPWKHLRELCLENTYISEAMRIYCLCHMPSLQRYEEHVSTKYHTIHLRKDLKDAIKHSKVPIIVLDKNMDIDNDEFDEDDLEILRDWFAMTNMKVFRWMYGYSYTRQPSQNQIQQSIQNKRADIQEAAQKHKRTVRHVQIVEQVTPGDSTSTFHAVILNIEVYLD